MTVERAYSTFEVKSFDDDQRIITGVATTPTTDRMGDIVEPKGAEFKLPIALLWQHRSDEPVGNVTAAKVTKDGITITAKFEKVDQPASLKEELDRAWAKVKAGLVRGLSIGFRPLETTDMKDGSGIRFLRWNWVELSCVTIPANAEATISTIKSVDDSYLRAASGAPADKGVVRLSTTPGATGKLPKGTQVKTTAEQIASFEAKRQANAARMTALMEARAEKGETLDESESQEYDGLQGEIKAIDTHLTRLKALEAINVVKAAPIVEHKDDALPNSGIVSVTHNNLPKGTAFTRYAMLLARSRGNLMHAAEMAKQYKDTPEVELTLKTAVAAGTTTDATWALPLVYAENMASEFVELLRPATIIGKIQGFRRVPFNIRMPSQTSGSTAGWVGEGLNKPVSKLAFSTVTLGYSKIAVIVVLTEELVRFSNPAAEAVCRQDMIDAIVQFMDRQFIDPDVAAVTNVSPASITNGVSPVNSTGSTIATVTANVTSLFAKFAAADIGLEGSYWIMNPRTALALSMLRTTQDIFAFPGISMTGGTFQGLPVIVSSNVPISSVSNSETYAVLLKPSEILMADDGGVTLDVSSEASLQMSDAPVNSAQSVVSMWQTNMIALKAERYINYKKRRSAAVQIWDGLVL